MSISFFFDFSVEESQKNLRFHFERGQCRLAGDMGSEVGGHVSPRFESAVFDFCAKNGCKCLINVNWKNLEHFQTCRMAFTAREYLEPFSSK